VRLLLLNQFYPPDPAPTGRVLHDLARALVARGHEVQVLCSRHSYHGGADYPAQEVRDGIGVRRLRALSFGRAGHVGRALDYGSFLASLLGRLAAGRPRFDLVLALTTPPYLGLLAALAARRRRRAHAHWLMDLYPDALVAHGWLREGGPALRALRRLARWQVRGAATVVCPGPRMAAHAEQGLGVAVGWVPLWAPGLPPASGDEVARLRAARGWAPADQVLLFSGNLGLGHRYAEFLALAERLGPAGPRWAFVGDGARRAMLEAFVRGHPRARVSVHPPEPEERLGASLLAGDVHLVSQEPAWSAVMVPSKLQAAFAAGRPVIFVGPEDCDAAAWVREAGAGWVVPPGDDAALEAAVAETRDPAERARRGTAGQSFARRHFDREGNAGRLVELLERAGA
jgi:glycosyltransferase involved in cell wall biosynthesis